MLTIESNRPTNMTSDKDWLWSLLRAAKKSRWNNHLDFSKPAYVVTYNEQAEYFDEFAKARKRMADLVYRCDYRCELSIGGRNDDGVIEQCGCVPLLITTEYNEQED